MIQIYMMHTFGILLLLNIPVLFNSCSFNRYHFKTSTTRIWNYRQPIKSSDFSCGDILLQQHLQLIEHVEGDILNFEIYNDMFPPAVVRIIRNLPKVFRVIKPIAKAGIRTYGTPATPEMKRIIAEKFSPVLISNENNNHTSKTTEKEVEKEDQDEDQDEEGEVKAKDMDNITIGVFVYMFVQESFRGGRWGDTLLQLAYRECHRQGYRYMLLVHDDNGSGKLIRYYESRGFQSIQSFLPKGMIRQLDR